MEELKDGIYVQFICVQNGKMYKGKVENISELTQSAASYVCLGIEKQIENSFFRHNFED